MRDSRNKRLLTFRLWKIKIRSSKNNKKSINIIKNLTKKVSNQISGKASNSKMQKHREKEEMVWEYQKFQTDK